MKRFKNAADFRDRNIDYVEFDEAQPHAIGVVVKFDGTRQETNNDVDYNFALMCVERGWWQPVEESNEPSTPATGS